MTGRFGTQWSLGRVLGRVLALGVCAVVVVLFAACGEGDTPAEADAGAGAGEPGATADVEPSDGTSAAATDVVPRADRLTGIAGLIPANHPQPSDEDWRAFFDLLGDLGNVAGNYTALEELGRNQPIGQAAGVEVLPITSIHQDTGVGLDVTYDFRDLAEASAFTEGIVAFAREHQPPWLGIGNEVNRIADDEPEAFEAWVTSLPALRDAIRQASPGTRVFVTFQYEFLLGDERVSGRVRTPDWSAVERVTPYLDAVAYTTYPYFTYADPGDVPADYYQEAVERSGGLPVGFTEIGWPSASIGAFEGTAVAELGGTPEEQEAFIRRLPELFEGVDPALVMWVWAFDTPAISDVFGSIGLHENDGTPKPALQAWLDFVATR